MTDIKRFYRAYYLFNVLVLLSYPLARHWAVVHRGLSKGVVHTEEDLMSWEKQGFSLLGIVTLVKFTKRQSMDSFFSDFFLYMKVCILVLAYVLDIRLFSWYWMCYVLLFALVQQPKYSGPSKFRHLTPAGLDQVVKKEHNGVSWLIEFHAAWSAPCLHLEPALAALSLKYTTEKMKFGKVDIGRWPVAGEQHRISTSASSNQLPTLILFEEGKEVARIPHVFKDGSFVKGKYRMQDIVKGFNLDGKYKETIVNANKNKQKQKSKNKKEESKKAK